MSSKRGSASVLSTFIVHSWPTRASSLWGIGAPEYSSAAWACVFSRCTGDSMLCESHADTQPCTRGASSSDAAVRQAVPACGKQARCQQWLAKRNVAQLVS